MTDYSTLPEGLSPDELAPHFLDVVERRPTDVAGVMVSLDDLAELALRQWHTYEPISPSLSVTIIQWLKSTQTSWATSAEGVEAVQAVAMQLGLRDVAERLAALATEAPDGAVRDELAAVDWPTVLIDIEDPWARLKEQVAAKSGGDEDDGT